MGRKKRQKKVYGGKSKKTMPEMAPTKVVTRELGATKKLLRVSWGWGLDATNSFKKIYAILRPLASKNSSPPSARILWTHRARRKMVPSRRVDTHILCCGGVFCPEAHSSLHSSVYLVSWCEVSSNVSRGRKLVRRRCVVKSWCIANRVGCVRSFRRMN